MLQKINTYHHLTPTQVVEQLKTDLQDALFHKVAMATFGNQRFFLKPEKFEQFCQILAVLDLKLVPKEMQCFDKRDIATLLHQAKRYMELIQHVDQLQEE